MAVLGRYEMVPCALHGRQAYGDPALGRHADDSHSAGSEGDAFSRCCVAFLCVESRSRWSHPTITWCSGCLTSGSWLLTRRANCWSGFPVIRDTAGCSLPRAGRAGAGGSSRRTGAHKSGGGNRSQIQGKAGYALATPDDVIATKTKLDLESPGEGTDPYNDPDFQRVASFGSKNTEVDVFRFDRRARQSPPSVLRSLPAYGFSPAGRNPPPRCS